MMNPTLKDASRSSVAHVRASGRIVERAVFECYAPGRYGDPDSPSARYDMELTSFKGGDVEAYFTSSNSPVPIFAGYARELAAGFHLECLFDEAMATVPWREDSAS